jgi:hypothetical protein
MFLHFGGGNAPFGAASAGLAADPLVVNALFFILLNQLEVEDPAPANNGWQWQAMEAWNGDPTPAVWGQDVQPPLLHQPLCRDGEHGE